MSAKASTDAAGSRDPVVEIDGDAVVGRVMIRAAPDAVFRAFTEPAQIVQWWGSRDQYWVTDWQSDLRPGGGWSSKGTSVAGKPFDVSGVFRAVERPRRLVYTWKASWDEGLETVVEITFERSSEGTLVRMRHSGFQASPKAKASILGGMPSVLAWLRGFAEGSHHLGTATGG